MPRYVAGDPIPPEFLTAAGINRLLDRIEALRAVLVPLLAKPYRDVDGFSVCLFCDGWEPRHEPGCPVLPANRDDLLGTD
jgi:hypothetical protein